MPKWSRHFKGTTVAKSDILCRSHCVKLCVEAIRLLRWLFFILDSATQPVIV